MRDFSQTKVQKWEDVDCYAGNVTCHICSGVEKVKTGKIPEETIDFSILKVMLVGVTFWRLCENCHFDGWTPPSKKILGKFSYFKTSGGRVKVLTV